MELNRRAAMAAVAAPAVAFVPKPTNAAMAWPHPDVGQVMYPGMPMRKGVYTGAWREGDRVIDPGRFYTDEEWSRVGRDVTRFVKARLDVIRATDPRPVNTISGPKPFLSASSQQAEWLSFQLAEPT